MFREVAGGELAGRLIKLGEGLARQRGTALLSSLAATKSEATNQSHFSHGMAFLTRPLPLVYEHRYQGPALNSSKGSAVRQTKKKPQWE